MRIIFEKGDLVKIKEDWRDWKKGEIAEIISVNLRTDSFHSDNYTLLPINESDKDFHVLSDDMFEICT